MRNRGAALQANNMKIFGVCSTCRYNSKAEGGGYFWNLFSNRWQLMMYILYAGSMKLRWCFIRRKHFEKYNLMTEFTDKNIIDHEQKMRKRGLLLFEIMQLKVER